MTNNIFVQSTVMPAKPAPDLIRGIAGIQAAWMLPGQSVPGTWVLAVPMANVALVATFHAGTTTVTEEVIFATS